MRYLTWMRIHVSIGSITFNCLLYKVPIPSKTLRKRCIRASTDQDRPQEWDLPKKGWHAFFAWMNLKHMLVRLFAFSLSKESIHLLPRKINKFHWKYPIHEFIQWKTINSMQHMIPLLCRWIDGRCILDPLHLWRARFQWNFVF